MQDTNTAKQMRILHVMSGFGGGISSFIFNKAKQMPEYGVIFDVATYDECSPEFESAIYATGGQIYRLQNPKKKGTKAFTSSFSAPFEANQYDLVHCHIEGYRAIPYYQIAKKFGVQRFYIHAHLMNDYKIKNLKDKFLNDFGKKVNTRMTTDFVGCGKLAIKSVFGQKTNLQESMVIPNSIDINDYNYSDEAYAKLKADGRSALGVSDHTLVIGHVGRLMPVKNHKKTLKIGQYILDHQIDAKIFIIGAGNLEAELKQAVKDQGLDEVISFTGRISPIANFYPSLDVLLLPSFTEGLPTTVVEVQGAGVPTVMSDTITDEVDLGLGMVATCGLEDDAAIWYDKLAEMSQLHVPDAQTRLQAIEAKRFSNEASAKLYVDYFTGKIHDYQI